MIDVHCHLQFHAFKDDFEEVIKRAFVKGVTHIINTATQIDSSQKAIEFATNFDNLSAIVGVHPHHADKIDGDSSWLSKLRTMALHPKVVAVGEVGMDFYNYKSNGIVDPKKQQVVFEKQIELAYECKKPLQIHNRLAGKHILEILEHHKNLLLPLPGMFHCFAGNRDLLKRALSLGFYIGFDGNSTYKGLAPGEDTLLSDLIAYTPLERIVTETDAPFLTPEPYRGKRNEPSYVILVVAFIAKVKSLPQETVEKETERNARTLFQI